MSSIPTQGGLPPVTPPNTPPELDLPPAGDDPADDHAPTSPQQTVEDLGEGKTATNAGEAQDALAWLLEDLPADRAGALDTKEIRTNVGRHDAPRWIQLTIRAVPEDETNRIRKATLTRASKRKGPGAGLPDETEVNCRVLAKAIVVPDLAQVHEQVGVPPHQWVRMKLGHKPGLITQLVGEVYELSGYDDGDVTDVGEG